MCVRNEFVFECTFCVSVDRSTRVQVCSLASGGDRPLVSRRAIELRLSHVPQHNSGQVVQCKKRTALHSLRFHLLLCRTSPNTQLCLSFCKTTTGTDADADSLSSYQVCMHFSERLDLSDESIYRDLRLPMGAIGKERAEQFRQRFESWDDNDIPAFHYGEFTVGLNEPVSISVDAGTHYSSSASVLYFLVRLEPFTRIALELQG